MLTKKILIACVLFFSMLSLSNAAFAKEAKRPIPEVLKEVDAKIQSALDTIPSGKSEEIVALIKSANESAGGLSANYKFEFERDKAMILLKKARDAAKKSDFAGAEKDLKAAKENFANLINFK